MKRIICRGTYPASTTGATLDSWRNGKVSLYDSDEITGVIIASEGELWVELEGAASVINAERDDLADDPLFTDFDVTKEENITSRTLNRCYLYNELRTPVATTAL